MKRLFFDIAITGHHSEYIGHIINYLGNVNFPNNQFYFVVNPKFATTFPDIYHKASMIKNLNWIPISDYELMKVEGSNGIWSSLMAMKILDRYAKRYRVDHVMVLDFHPIKYASIFYTPPYRMSSILFLLFHRLNKETWKQKLEYFKRYYITKWSSANKQLNKIFILNDSDAVDFMNKEFKTNCFEMLPDPIPNLKPLEDFDIYSHYAINQERKIFLHIGALGDRKGTREVIESALHLGKVNQRKVAILLAGKASNAEDEKSYLELIKDINERTNVHMIWDNQFVPNRMMKSLFNQCDTVLLPYKNAEFSSGILGHAAAANKRVIATNAGLIKNLVNRYQLGSLLDNPNAADLADKMTQIMSIAPNKEGQSKFVEEHSPEVFALTILS